MKPFRCLLFLLPVICVACSPAKPTSQTANRWVSLFDGKSLANWTPKIAGHAPGDNFNNTFRVENGILSTRYDQYNGFRSTFGALFYNQKFTNFRLKVEYRFVGDTASGAPSWGFRDGGIQYQCQSPQSMAIDQPFPVCLEYNILGGSGKEPRPTGEICASGMYVDIDGKRNTLYCTPPTVKKTIDGEVWATAEIEVRDGHITHYVNGEPVLSFDNPHFDTSNANVKRLNIAGNDLVTDGYISLQSNSHPMDFRKIEIMEYRR